MPRRLTCEFNVLRNTRFCRANVFADRPVIAMLIFRIWFCEHGFGVHAPGRGVIRCHELARPAGLSIAIRQVVGELQILDVDRHRRSERVVERRLVPVIDPPNEPRMVRLPSLSR